MTDVDELVPGPSLCGSHSITRRDGTSILGMIMESQCCSQGCTRGPRTGYMRGQHMAA